MTGHEGAEGFVTGGPNGAPLPAVALALSAETQVVADLRTPASEAADAVKESASGTGA